MLNFVVFAKILRLSHLDIYLTLFLKLKENIFQEMMISPKRKILLFPEMQVKRKIFTWVAFSFCIIFLFRKLEQQLRVIVIEMNKLVKV